MKKIIITYGLISGAIASSMLFVSMPLMQNGILSYNTSMVVGFTSMFVAFSMIFFGIRNYRDNHQRGTITFGKGFQIGILIALIASLLYAVSWEIYYSIRGDEFNKWYVTCQIEKLTHEGASPTKIEEAREKITNEMEMYKNFSVRFGLTFMEIFPVGLIAALLTAAILRKRESQST